MSEVKRYVTAWSDAEGPGRMVPVDAFDANGDVEYVTYDDHAEALARVERDLRDAHSHHAEEVDALKAEVAEWNDPDSDKRQALLEQIIFDMGPPDRSELDMREAQLAMTEAANATLRAEVERLKDDLRVVKHNLGDDYSPVPHIGDVVGELQRDRITLRAQLTRLQSEKSAAVEVLRGLEQAFRKEASEYVVAREEQYEFEQRTGTHNGPLRAMYSDKAETLLDVANRLAAALSGGAA